MPKLLLIATGGTIASLPANRGLEPALRASQLLALCPPPNGCQIECLDLFNMDSSNIQPEEWLIMAQTIAQKAPGFDGVVLTHGTDTMAYTASMLSFLLQNPPIPIVLTGAQYPLIRPDSDGRANLLGAMAAATGLYGGVYICFGSAVMRGCRAVKTRTSSPQAFESINAPYIGTVVNGKFVLLEAPPASTPPFRQYTAIEPRVALVKLIPGTAPEQITMLKGCGVRGVVVEAFGLGGVSNFRRDHAEAIAQLMRGDIPVVLASQCLYEASTPDLYAVSRPLKEAGVISAEDMTTEAAVTKLMWALAQSDTIEGVRRLLQTDLCGEISAPASA
jgi:L-asparaginase